MLFLLGLPVTSGYTRIIIAQTHIHKKNNKIYNKFKKKKGKI